MLVVLLCYEIYVHVCVTCAVRSEALQVREVLCVLPRISHSEEGSQVGVGGIRRKTQSSPLKLNPRLKPRTCTQNTHTHTKHSHNVIKHHPYIHTHSCICMYISVCKIQYTIIPDASSAFCQISQLLTWCMWKRVDRAFLFCNMPLRKHVLCLPG